MDSLIAASTCVNHLLLWISAPLYPFPKFNKASRYLCSPVIKLHFDEFPESHEDFPND